MSDERSTSFAFTHRIDLPGAPGKLDDHVSESRTAFDAARTGAGRSSARTAALSPAASSLPEPHLVLPDPRPDFAGPERRPVNDNAEAPVSVPDLRAAFDATRQEAATPTPSLHKSR